jgi:membrane-associated phospholipid phosphatase
MGKTPCAVLLAIILSIPVQAQSVGHDLENGFKDIIYIWTAPGRLRSDALPEIGVVLGGTGALMLVDEPLYRWLSTHPTSVPGMLVGVFREGRPLNLIGRSFVLIPTSVALYSAGWAFDEPNLRQAGIGCLSSNVATTLSRGVISMLLPGRLRPRYGKGAFDFQFIFPKKEWERRSFPGGHASHIMSCVSFWNNRFDLGVAEPVLYGTALAVGWSRVVDGAHWPSDTYFGQAYGWAIGNGVADRYLQRSSSPAVDRAPGLGIVVRISF